MEVWLSKLNGRKPAIRWADFLLRIYKVILLWEKEPGIPAHAQPVNLHIWQEAHVSERGPQRSLLPLAVPRVFSWWRHQMEIFSALLAICAGNSPVSGEFPAQRPVTRSFDVFFDLCPINDWVNNREAGDLRRSRAHYDVIVMSYILVPADYPKSIGLHYSTESHNQHVNSLYNKNTLETCKNPRPTSGWSELTKLMHNINYEFPHGIFFMNSTK